MNGHRPLLAAYLDGNLAIVNNDALSELRPVNTLVVNGQAKRSVANFGPFEINEPASEFVQATARHDGLYRRAGGTALHASTHISSDSESRQEVVAEARRELAEAIGGATAGDMQTRLRGPVSPFDVVEAKPTCDGTPATDTEPLSYEVSRVHHKIRTGDDGPSHTELNVGVHVDPQEDISVEWRWKDA